MFRKYQDKPQFYFIVILILGIIALWLFYPKHLLNWIKTPNEANECSIICNYGKTADSVTIKSKEHSKELKQLLQDISRVSIQYTGPYEYIEFQDGKPVYDLYFWNSNEELGHMIINGTVVYDVQKCSYRITGKHPLFISSVLDTTFFFEIGTVNRSAMH